VLHEGKGYIWSYIFISAPAPRERCGYFVSIKIFDVIYVVLFMISDVVVEGDVVSRKVRS
jgi:hypothetical protein